MRRALTAISALLLLSSTLAACSRDEAQQQGASPAATVSDVPLSDQLPPLELRDDTENLLLTWIDEQGDFHVGQKPSEVPEASRSQVRVVVTTQEEGSGQLVYVADLTSKATAGTYSVKTMTRAQWNEIGAQRRKVRMDELAKQMPEVAPKAEEPSGDELSPEEKKANSRVKAIVYGADWCKPCHNAEDFLKKLGVDVTKKDIEESRAARAEMQQKLAAAGRMGASIPVLDVGGKIMVGFNESAVRRAVAEANKPETL